MIALAVVAVVAMGLQSALSARGDDQAVAAVGVGATGASSTSPPPAASQTVATATTATTAATPAGAPGSTAGPGLGAPLDPSWPKELYVLSDSVLLSGKTALPERFAGWRVTIDGKPALMVKKALEELKGRTEPVGSVAVVALGYNSLWEKDRRNYGRWAKKFDDEADALVARLKDLGAKKVVWVTVRELSPEIVPAKAVKELPLYSWYFPWVNERLRALLERHPEVALADWSAASQTNGLTYDSIHLNTSGAPLMADVIAKAVGA